MEEYKKKTWKIGLIIGLIIVVAFVFYNLGNPHREIKGFSCSEGQKNWAMWNNETATTFGINPEQIANFTYAYLFDYELECPQSVKDCFIDVPVERCCYWTEDYLYCRTELKYKEDNQNE